MFSYRGRSMEKPVDNLPAQDICSHFNGDSTAENVTEEAIPDDRGVFFCLCHFQPSWSGHRHSHWCNDTRAWSWLDLCHLHGPCLWCFHLRCHQPSDCKRVQTTGSMLFWHPIFQVSRSVSWCGDYSRRDDLGYLAKYSGRFGLHLENTDS